MATEIIFLWRQEVDVSKWNKTIDHAENGLIYAYTFYLDAMCTHWAGLVLNDYEAVMPLPWRKKYGIYYLYSPAFTAQLGVFGNTISASMLEAFFKAVPKKFQYWDFPLNHKNIFSLPSFPLYRRTNFVLEVQKSYEQLWGQYRENIKRNIKKAVNYGCYTEKDIDLQPVLELAKLQMPQTKIGEEDIGRFGQLYHYLQPQKMATAYGVYSAQKELIASCVFTFSHNRAYYILVGNHPNGRTLGASHQLIDAFIKEHAGQKLLLDFEGSDLRNLAFFYTSFGAVNEDYAAIRINRLPWWIKWWKQ